MPPIMLQAIIRLMVLIQDPATADGLRSTAPVYLTPEQAAEHSAAAAYAARQYQLDDTLLLSIAYHESRYTDAVTPEPGGKYSCGTMTPVPQAHCSRQTPVEGYLAGAAHLRGWITAERGDLRLALLGYAGGGRLIRACADGPVLTHGVDACHTPAVFLARAAWIRTERRRARARVSS